MLIIVYRLAYRNKRHLAWQATLLAPKHGAEVKKRRRASERRDTRRQETIKKPRTACIRNSQRQHEDLCFKSMKVVLIPGMGCTPVATSNWYTWFATEMKKRPDVDCCIVEDFPDPYKCRESIWMPHVQSLIGSSDDAANTIIVGHSSGAACAMRLLEQTALTTPLAGCILVAAAYTDLDDEDERLSGYFNRPWNWERMAQGASKKIVLFHGTDDHLIPIQEARYIAEQLEFSENFDFREMPGNSHFFRPWPELLDEMDNILNNG